MIKPFSPTDYGYAKFWPDKDNNTISEMSLYNLYDLRSSDVVLDIGANIGAFSLLVSNKCKWVYALEPIRTRRLRENILLNNTKNITVIEGALGNKNCTAVWRRSSIKTNCYTLQEIIDKYGQIDFLKIDCEGCEHIIKQEELKGIRRIEAEIHDNVNEFENILKNTGFSYTRTDLHVQTNFKELAMISAYK